jgi:hypothetical protein
MPMGGLRNGIILSGIKLVNGLSECILHVGWI